MEKLVDRRNPGDQPPGLDWGIYNKSFREVQLRRTIAVNRSLCEAFSGYD